MQKVSLDKGVVGYFFSPEKNGECPAVLLVHGWGSTQIKNIARAKDLVELGYVCLTIDLRGHGESEGDFKTLTGADHLADLIAAYDFLASRDEVDSEQISVVGSSYGGYLATLLTGEREVSNLVLRVPANYKDKGLDKPTYEARKDYDIQDYREAIMTPENSRVLQAASQFTGNVWIIESENDEIIPHQTIENYKNAFTNVTSLKYTLMQGAGHVLNPEEQSQYSTLLNKYFSSAIMV